LSKVGNSNNTRVAVVSCRKPESIEQKEGTGEMRQLNLCSLHSKQCARKKKVNQKH